MRVVFFVALLALAAPAFAKDGPRQVVRTASHTFEADRTVLTSDRRKLIDMRDLAAGVGKPGAFSIRILSAAGPVVSVLVRWRSCNDETCHDQEEVQAWRGTGGEARLADLLAEGGLLRALKGNRQLRAMLAARGNRAVETRVLGARTWREAADALTFEGVRTPAGVAVLPSNRVDCFVVEGYDEGRNVLSLRLHMRTTRGSLAERRPGITLAATPGRAFAEALARDRREGVGLLAGGR